MSQIQLFGEFGADPSPKEKAPKPKPQPKSAAKRIETAVVQKIEIPLVHSKPKPTRAFAKWGLCWVCGEQIAIPGLDASLCSNPARTCGSSGWVTDPQWLALQSQKGGKANG